jgi:hypothetical protein
MVQEQFIPYQAHNPVLLNDDMGGEVDGVDLGDFFGTQHVDYVFSDELSHLPDAGQPLNKDGSDKFLVLKTVQETDTDIVDHRTILRYFPYLSCGEKRAGCAVTVGAPQDGHVGESVYVRSAGQRRIRPVIGSSLTWAF